MHSRYKINISFRTRLKEIYNSVSSVKLITVFFCKMLHLHHAFILQMEWLIFHPLLNRKRLVCRSPKKNPNLSKYLDRDIDVFPSLMVANYINNTQYLTLFLVKGYVLIIDNWNYLVLNALDRMNNCLSGFNKYLLKIF